MALEYEILVDADIDEVFVIEEIERLTEKKSAVNPGFPITASPFRISTYAKEIIRENFGFIPETGYTLALDKFAEAERSSAALIQVSLALTQNNTVKNSVLLSSDEIPIFHYTGGTLFLNESRGFWNDTRLALVRIHYELKEIAVL